MDKSIGGYPNYSISEVGEIKNVKTGRELKLAENNGGYLIICLCKDGKQKTILVHRLIYETFVGEIPTGLEIDHIDRNPLNNAISNLRVVTHSENLWNKTGIKGYWFRKDKRKWQASIRFNGTDKYLGLFDTEAEAHTAYLNAKNIYHVIE